ncbi:MAG: AAA family ATPase [Oscillospiraceae bacterium]|nr:AAA family ATPase [Oscillospiraceae bacterium]
MAKTILVASGKGGVGKSTVSVFLAEALAAAGSPVLILELDSGLRNLDVSLGLAGDIVFDFGDVLRGSCNIKDAVYPCRFCQNLLLIPAALKPAEILVSDIKNVIEQLGENFEYIIMDCPAGLGEAFENAAGCTDMALVIATPDPSSVRGARTTGAELLSLGVKNRRLVIERCPQKAKNLAPIKHLDEIIDGTELQLIGVIWEDPDVRIAMDSGTALDVDSTNYKTFRDLSERIRGNNIPLGFK